MRTKKYKICAESSRPTFALFLGARLVDVATFPQIHFHDASRAIRRVSATESVALRQTDILGS